MSHKSFGLFHFITGFNHPAELLILKLRVTLPACRPPSPLCSSWQPQCYWIFRLESGWLAIAAFVIDTMVILMIDVTNNCFDSSSLGKCHEYNWVLFSPTIFPATYRWLMSVTHILIHHPWGSAMSITEYCIHPPSSQQHSDKRGRWPSLMASQGNGSRHGNSPLSANTCDSRSLPYHLLYLQIITNSSRRIRVMKYIPTWANFHFLDVVSSIPLLLR